MNARASRHIPPKISMPTVASIPVSLLSFLASPYLTFLGLSTLCVDPSHPSSRCIDRCSYVLCSELVSTSLLHENTIYIGLFSQLKGSDDVDVVSFGGASCMYKDDQGVYDQLLFFIEKSSKQTTHPQFLHFPSSTPCRTNVEMQLAHLSTPSAAG
jgi:hypothetical protein